MFITDQDYTTVIGQKALETITQLDAAIRHQAEQTAISEAKGYLWPRYDVDVIFAREGSERNARLVTTVVDIALYHLSASLPQRMGTDVRQERYERAIHWLEDVSKGNIVPDDLPLMKDDNGVTHSGINIKSNPRYNNEW